MQNTKKRRGDLSLPTVRAGSWPNFLEMESGRHFFFDMWNVAHSIFEWLNVLSGWNFADT